MFTCISCRVAFKEAEIQRMHYKSDWHRYNLKRKIVDLPPVTAEEFQRRVQNQRNNDAIIAQDKSVYCYACRKSFGNDRAYVNHVNSKKHKEREVMAATIDESKITVKKKEEDSDVEEVDSDEWNEDEEENPIDYNNCLFCLHHSSNLLKNLHHMTEAHTFFIPDVEYCVDIEGLLRYLGEKITQGKSVVSVFSILTIFYAGYMCLWCNDKGKTFHSADAARKHMLDKGHCKMLHEGLALAEYADFYDYSSSYPDNDDNIDVDEEVIKHKIIINITLIFVIKSFRFQLLKN